MSAEAIILAAGLGLRMRPLTERMPKPLVPVAGKALIDYSLDFAADAGLAEVVVNASYKAEMLEAHIAERATPRVVLSREAEPLETGGGIREALPLLSRAPFFAINSDVICLPGAAHPLHRLAASWDGAKMDALLLVQRVKDAVGYDGPGDFFLADESLVDGGMLKRRGHALDAPYVFTGIQYMHPRLFEGCPATGAFSLNKLYDRGITAEGEMPRIFALVHDGAWLHVGDMPGLEAAEDYLRSSSLRA